jgi:lysophospholipase L1-like esterase
MIWLLYQGYQAIPEREGNVTVSQMPIVLCFGDSLTAGFQSPSRSNPTGKDTPYGHFLQELIGPNRQVVVSGICGELTGEMVMRFRQDVLNRRPSHVIILGGTNDLGWNAQPREIMRNLVKMYEQARADQVVPVPVTVPSIRAPGDSGGQEAELWIGDHLSRRRQLNGLIAEYADSHDLAWIDLFQATLEKETEQLAEAYSNDGLHLTTAGYRMLAQLVYQRVFAAPFSAQARPQ